MEHVEQLVEILEAKSDKQELLGVLEAVENKCERRDIENFDDQLEEIKMAFKEVCNSNND